MSYHYPFGFNTPTRGFERFHMHIDPASAAKPTAAAQEALAALGSSLMINTLSIAKLVGPTLTLSEAGAGCAGGELLDAAAAHNSSVHILVAHDVPEWASRRRRD